MHPISCMRLRGVSLCLLAVCLATLAVYSVSFPGEFHYDDYPLILDNPRVNGDTFPLSLFIDQYGGRPLTMLTFFINHRTAADVVWSYQAINLLLHLFASCLFFIVARRLFSSVSGTVADTGSGRELAALFAALVFALHPLQTQAVNYVWSRSVILMTCFGLLALLIIRRAGWLALIFFQLAIWSRAEALILAVPLVALRPRAWKWVVPASLVNLALFVRSVSVYSPREVAWNHSNALSYWLAQPYVYCKYLLLMLWPRGLTIDHDLKVSAWSAAAGAVALLVLVAILVLMRRRLPESAIGLAWLGLALLPSAVIPNTDLLNESRAYPAMIGFALAVAGMWLALNRPVPFRRRWPAMLVAAVLLAGLVAGTWERNRIWRTEVGLWTDAAAKAPGKGRVHYNLGSALARQGDVQRARAHFTRARDLDPADDYSHAALGYCYEQAQELPSALRCYRKAISLNPDNDYAREGLERIRLRVELERPDEGL